VLALRRSEPALHHDHWFQAPPARSGACSLSWSTPAGAPMQVHDWHDHHQHAFSCHIDASRLPRPAVGSRHLWLAFNPGPAPLEMRIPAGRWQVALDSALELAVGSRIDAERLAMPAQALVVLRDAGEAA
jgi:pullulanase/glycogen debranching enzyme